MSLGWELSGERGCYEMRNVVPQVMRKATSYSVINYHLFIICIMVAHKVPNQNRDPQCRWFCLEDGVVPKTRLLKPELKLHVNPELKLFLHITSSCFSG